MSPELNWEPCWWFAFLVHLVRYFSLTSFCSLLYFSVRWAIFPTSPTMSTYQPMLCCDLLSPMSTFACAEMWNHWLQLSAVWFLTVLQIHARQSQKADFASGTQFAAIVYNDKARAWHSLVNTLEIYDYLVQHVAYVTTGNTRHHGPLWKHGVIHKTGSTYCTVIRGPSHGHSNMYRKFCEVWRCTVIFKICK